MNQQQINHLISLSKKRNRAAQKALYEFTYEKLMNVPLRYINSLEDANWHFNLAMLNVYESLKNFSMKRDYIPWARVIIIRSTINQLRQNNKFKSAVSVVDIDFLEDHSASELNNALNQLQYNDILTMLRTLPEKQRIIFSLHEIDEMTHEEIENLTGIKLNTSKWLLAKAKKNMQNKLHNLKVYSCG